MKKIWEEAGGSVALGERNGSLASFDAGGTRPDPDWVTGSFAGDHAAVARAFDHFWGELLAFTRRRTGPRVQRWFRPEDVALDVFVETVQRLPRLSCEPTEMAFRGHLFRTAGQRLKDLGRRCARRAGESEIPPLRREPIAPRTASEVAEHRDMLRWLRRHVSRLDPHLRDVILLCTYCEMSFEAASRVLRLSSDTIRKRHRRALAILRARAEKEAAT